MIKYISGLIFVFLVGCAPWPEPSANFNVGDKVYYKTDTNKTGIVTDIRSHGHFYVVRFSITPKSDGIWSFGTKSFDSITVRPEEIELMK